MSQSGLLSQPHPLCSSSSEGNGPRCVCPHADWKKRAIPMDAFHLIAVIGNQTNQLTANGNVDGAGFFSISSDLRRAMQTKTSIVLKKKRKRDWKKENYWKRFIFERCLGLSFENSIRFIKNVFSLDHKALYPLFKGNCCALLILISLCERSNDAIC